MAYISTAEVKEIRNELKKAFPHIKFGVKRSNGTSVDVRIISSKDINFNEDYMQINTYSIDKTFSDRPEIRDVLNKTVHIIKTAPAKAEGGSEWYDNSDVMTDYFNTAFYFHLNIGSWDKAYEFKS